MVQPPLRFDRDYLQLTVGLVGTTIAPWMQFYQQSAVVDKGLRVAAQATTMKTATMSVLFYIVRLAARRDLMGTFANTRAVNGILWATTVIMTVLTILSLLSQFGLW